MRSARCRAGRAFSLVEVVVASAIIGVMLVAAVGAAGAAGKRRVDNSDRAMASYLASSLMDEVCRQSYSPAVIAAIDLAMGGGGTVTAQGEGGGASVVTGRGSFTTLDAYSGYEDKPPTQRDGSLISEASKFSRSVTVEYVDPANPNTLSATDQGLRRVTVTVMRRGVAIAKLTAFRSSLSDWSRE